MSKTFTFHDTANAVSTSEGLITGILYETCNLNIAMSYTRACQILSMLRDLGWKPSLTPEVTGVKPTTDPRMNLYPSSSNSDDSI